ncbi:hypothetical protein F4777DRAFT_527793 [Nemania sp. FL0916]|nr:hypothetical protein F4777DRAFT_527793 [Nemania sp. FL0916]
MESSGSQPSNSIEPTSQISRGRSQRGYAPRKISCPYRKRNRARFNVRDYQNCATSSFKDLATLKRHIREFHRRPPRPPHECIRCHGRFQTSEQLEAHILAPPEQICSVNTQLIDDPEDGIDDETADALSERKNGRKIDTWRALWQLLYNESEGSPSSAFEPPKILELFEVCEAIKTMDVKSIAANIPSKDVIPSGIINGLLYQFLSNISEITTKKSESVPHDRSPPSSAKKGAPALYVFLSKSLNIVLIDPQALAHVVRINLTPKLI